MPISINLDNINAGIRKLTRQIGMLNFNDEGIIPYLMGVLNTLKAFGMVNLNQDIRELMNARSESDFKRIQYNIVSQMQPSRSIPEKKDDSWYI